MKHEEDKIIVFDRAELIFVFNFHPIKSFPDYTIGVKSAGTYKILLCSDDKNFGGENRVDTNIQHFTKPESFSDYSNSMMIYIPCRTAIIYIREVIYYVIILIFKNLIIFKKNGYDISDDF